MRFLLLLDTSGSMHGLYGEKIAALNLAAENFLEGVQAISPNIELAIITFGGPPSMQNFVPASEMQAKTYEASGQNRLNEALTLAQAVLKEDDITFIISDGLSDKRNEKNIALKGTVYAIALGKNNDSLANITKSPARVLHPYDAKELPEYALINANN